MTKPPAGKPRVSRMGEDTLALLCSAEDVVANRVEDDQRGWDFLLQWPSPPSDLSPDLRPTPLSCFVQVKSRNRAVRSWKLKLSNALRYAQENQPYFVVLMIFAPGQVSPAKIYVQHFWADQMRAALAAARQAHLDGRDDFHKIDFPIVFQDEEACTPQTLVATLAKAMEKIGPAYPARKMALRQTLGYEDGGAVGRFRFDDSVDLETFVDMLLGRVAVPVTNFEVRDERFGLAGSVLLPASSGMMSVQVEPRADCTLVITSPDGAETVRLSGGVYAPGMPNLPPEVQKLRLWAPPLEVIMRRTGEQTITLSYDGAAQYDILTLQRIVSLWAWSGQGDLQIEAWSLGRPMLKGSAPLGGVKGGPYWLRLHRILRRLLAFAPADVWPAGARFNLVDMMEGINDLAKFAGMVSDPGMTLGCGKTPKGMEATLAACTRYIGPHVLDLGEATLFAVVVSPVEKVIEENPDKTDIRLGQPRVARTCSTCSPTFRRSSRQRRHDGKASAPLALRQARRLKITARALAPASVATAAKPIHPAGVRMRAVGRRRGGIARS